MSSMPGGLFRWSFPFRNNILLYILWIYNQRSQHTSSTRALQLRLWSFQPIVEKVELMQIAWGLPSQERFAELKQTQIYINFSLETNVFPEDSAAWSGFYGLVRPPLPVIINITAAASSEMYTLYVQTNYCIFNYKWPRRQLCICTFSVQSCLSEKKLVIARASSPSIPFLIQTLATTKFTATKCNLKSNTLQTSKVVRDQTDMYRSDFFCFQYLRYIRRHS